MKQRIASFGRSFAGLKSSTLGARILPYFASAAAVTACLITLTYFPLGDSSFTVIFVVLLACCWLGGLGPSIVASLLVLGWLRVAGKGLAGSLDFSPKEVVDFALVFLISTAIGWSGQVKRRADALLRRQAAQLLEASEERFRLLVEGTRDYAIFMLDPGGRIVSWNAGAERIKQYDSDEIIGQHFSRFYTPQDIRSGKPDRALQTALDEGRYEDEGLRVRKDGTEFWASVVITPLRDGDGHLRGFSKVTRDITQRKEAEENARRLLQEATARQATERYAAAIDAQRERLHVTLTSIGDGVITTDSEGRVTLLNPVAEALTGWSNYDADGQSLGTVFPIINEHTRKTAENPVARVIATGCIVGLANHTILIAKDGTERPIDDSAAPIRDQQGNVVGVVLVFRDISAKRQNEAAVQEAMQQLKIVTDSMSAPVTRCTSDLRYVWVNKPYAEWLGRPPEDIVGRPIREILGEEAFDRLLPYFQRVLSGKPSGYDEEVNFRGIGRRWICAVYTPTVDLAGKVDGWVAVVTDMTEHRRLEKALRDGDRRKNEFLATLSHELRNPLAPIRNAVHILKLKATSDPDAEWGLDVIDRQVQHMARLLDDLLDVSRISYNKMELRKGRVELADVVRRAVETSRPLIDESRHDLTVVLPSHPVYLEADPVRLAQVFSNLLNNAAKYTTKQGHIELTAERQGSDAVVSVKDDGVGITAEGLTGIFEIFSQAQPALDRSQGGLGIGLSLVKGLVELHGGSVEAKSDGAGRGSEFIVRLPVMVEVSAQAAIPRGGEAAPARPGAYRVLVVDDLKDSTDSLAMLLQLMGHEVEKAYDGEEAVSAAAAFRPDVIFLDIGLPKLNGYEAARRIRKEQWGNVVLIAMTGWGQEEDKQRALDAGFDHHLTKPVGNNALEKILESVPAMRHAE